MATIYKLICDDPELVYYGSTTMALRLRLNSHNCIANECSSKRLYEAGGMKIEEVEKCSKEQMKERENYYIQNFPCVNERDAIEGKEKQRIRYKRWKEKHPDAPKEISKRFNQRNPDYYKRKIICECGAEIQYGEVARHKRSQKHIKGCPK